MKPHPIAETFPRMSSREFNDLLGDIKAHGLREPIWTYEKQILDGRHRWDACQKLGIKPAIREFDGADPVAFVVSVNLKRRHLSDKQRAMVAAKVARLPIGANQHEGVPDGTPSREHAAELLNVSTRAVARAKAVQEKGSPALQKAVEEGDVSLSAGAEIAKLPKAEQKRALKAPTQKEKKPSRVEAENEQLKGELEQLKENLPELTAMASAAEALKNDEHFKKIMHLEAELVSVKKRRDELMRENAELKKQVAYWKKQAAKK